MGSARAAYAGQLVEARAAVRAAGDPYAKAVAEFTVGHLRAVVKLLDAIP